MCERYKVTDNYDIVDTKFNEKIATGLRKKECNEVCELLNLKENRIGHLEDMFDGASSMFQYFKRGKWNDER